MLDLFIVFAFMVYALYVGLRSRKKASRNLQEYFLAGKTLKGWQAGLSMAATQFAADTPLLVTGLIATGGIYELWRLWIYGVAFLMMAYVFSQGWRRAGVLTDAELTEIRYSGKGVLPLRILKAVYYGTVINCVVLAMVLVAATRIAEVFLPWHLWIPSNWYGIILEFIRWTGISISSGESGLSSSTATANNFISILGILSFTALYSTTGGLRSVVATDVMQFGVAMIASLLYAFVVVEHVGGLGGLTDGIMEIYGEDLAGKMLSFAPSDREIFLPFLALIGMQWFFQMNSDGTGYLAQRSMACATDRDARQAGVLFAWVQIFIRSLIWIVIAVGLLMIYPFSPEEAASDSFTATREILFVQGIEDLLPTGIRGLMLTGLLAALASTIDTHLNWGASYWSNDIYRKAICQSWLQREPQNHELVMVARLSNMFILIISLVIMANLGSIQQAWFMSLLFGAGMGSVLLLRWVWERINLYSELVAMGVSLTLAPILLMATVEEWIRIGIMGLVSTIAAIGVTFFTRPTEGEVLRRFYQKTHPMGFWRNTAMAMGENPNRPLERLLIEAKTTVTTALSLFFLLVGAGKLLIPSPDQSGWWAWFYILMGIGMVPSWWRKVFYHNL